MVGIVLCLTQFHSEYYLAMRHWYGPGPRRKHKHDSRVPDWLRSKARPKPSRPAPEEPPAKRAPEQRAVRPRRRSSRLDRMARRHGTRVLVALGVSVLVHGVLVLVLALVLRGVAQSGGGSVVSLDLGVLDRASDDFGEPPQVQPSEVQSSEPPASATDPDQASAMASLDRALRRVGERVVAAPQATEISRGEPSPAMPLLDRGGTPAGTTALTDLDATPVLDGASFAGVSASRARSVVYAVDASGAMVTSLPFVLDELRRSVSALAPDQSFAVVLFGRRPGEDADGPAVRTFPATGLVAAGPALKAELFAWLEYVQARGASNPLDGLLAAIDRQPEVVFLLSRSIRRTDGREAAGDWGPGREAILDELDRANPVRRSIFGPPARAVQVKCVQFLEEDPTGVMRAIARVHGGGPGSYRLLTESELGRR